MKDSYFSRTPKIRTHAEMQQTLEARSGKSLAGDRSRVPAEDSLSFSGESSGPAPLPPNLIPAEASIQTDSDSAARHLLEWDAPTHASTGGGEMVSTCKRYLIRKIHYEGTRTHQDHWLYYVWLNEPRKLLGYPRFKDEAIELAQRHADEHPDSAGEQREG
jgi:hypothetical protein